MNNLNYEDKISISLLETQQLIANKVAENKQMIQATARANYSAHTKNGKARYVSELVSSMGTQKEVSDFLDLKASRVSLLVKEAKRNGQ